MKRREFITLLGGAATAWPVLVRAQERVNRISVLIPIAASDPDVQPRVMTFQRALQELGWTVGRNLQIDYRWTGADAGHIRAYAREAVEAAPDLIVADGATIVSMLKQETRTLPVVFLNVSDPVGAGLVDSLAHVGGNITGFSAFEYPTSGKWLELLKEIAPHVTRVAIIQNPENPNRASYFRTIEAAASTFEVAPIATYVRSATDIERAIDAFAGDGNGGLIMLPGPFATVHRGLIVALAARHRLPAVSPYRVFATSGGLMSYGADLLDLYRRAASYVDRVLKGAKPAELPVQQPTKFELVINLKTAKALGLTVPERLLATADEVIE